MSWQLISILSLSVPGTDSTCSKCLFATFSSSQVSIGQKVCEMQTESKNVENVRHLETHDGVGEDVKRLMGSTTWGLPQVSWAITINCCAKGCYISQTSVSYLFIPSVDNNFWGTATAVRHLNLLCQQRWDTFKRFNNNLFPVNIV